MNTENKPKIRVAIVDDHLGMIDSYNLRLGQASHIEIVGAVHYGNELEPLLASQPADILILDVRVPISPDNSSLYPITDVIPNLRLRYPKLSIIIISQVAEPSLVRSVAKTGIKGYVLKGDSQLYEHLESVVTTVMNGGTCYSQKIADILAQRVEQLLTPRQQQAISLLAAHPEWTQVKIAKHMGISHSTARTLLSQAYERLGVETDTAAIMKAQELGIITPLEHIEEATRAQTDQR